MGGPSGGKGSRARSGSQGPSGKRGTARLDVIKERLLWLFGQNFAADYELLTSTNSERFVRLHYVAERLGCELDTARDAAESETDFLELSKDGDRVRTIEPFNESERKIAKKTLKYGSEKETETKQSTCTIQSQAEYYFSPDSLPYDAMTLSEFDSFQSVPLSYILSAPALQSRGVTSGELVVALRDSTVLRVEKDSSGPARVTLLRPLDKQDKEIAKRTLQRSIEYSRMLSVTQARQLEKHEQSKAREGQKRKPRK